MSWFWGSGSKKEEEYSDEEYDSEELYTDEDYDDDDDDDEGSFYDGEDHNDNDKEEGSEDEEEENVAETSRREEGPKGNGPSEEEEEEAPVVQTPASATEEEEVESRREEESPAPSAEETAADAIKQQQQIPSDESSSSSESSMVKVELDVQEQVDKGALPGEVDAAAANEAETNRPRLDSGLTFGDENASVPSSSSSSDEESSEHGAMDESKEEEEEQATSLLEKQSLLVLAAEHDRVDILQAILTVDEGNTVDEAPGLLQGKGDDTTSDTIPPLHIAVSYGSVNATNCLLRMGADPSIRPDVASIQAAGEEAPVAIAHMQRYNRLSAWELVFGGGSSGDGDENKEKEKGTWSLFSGEASSTLDIAPSKREGIRHAFTAEALRCIGSDEVHRLRQLLDAGMPRDIDIGGKDMYNWAVEMGSMDCEELLRPEPSAETDKPTEETVKAKDDETDETTPKRHSAVLDRSEPGEQHSIGSLRNRLDELESLAKALSGCLDNLGEEVAVCSGLLLMGSGASALASHVKSLRISKEQKEEESLRLHDAVENSQDELAYWVRECGTEGEKIASQVTAPTPLRVREEEPQDEEVLQQRRQQLQAQIAASENKIRMLRVSIGDLSEENTRNLAEVERRGLSGGINLVRGLREEIRDIDFQISELKSLDAECRTKISLVQAKLREKKAENAKVPPSMVTDDPSHAKEPVAAYDDYDPTGIALNDEDNKREHDPTPSEEPAAASATESQTAGLPSYDEPAPTETAGGLPSSEEQSERKLAAPAAGDDDEKPMATESSRIAAGQSTAIALRGEGSRGFFPISLWQILMRIIGLGDDPTLTPRRAPTSGGSRSTPAVII